MKNIFIIRHGQSEANTNVRGLLSDENKYLIDSSFDLTRLGVKQAYETAGKILDKIRTSKKRANKKYIMFVSPYKRTRNTANALEFIFTDKLTLDKRIEDPRLVEQDFGDFDFQFREKWPEISPHSFRVNQAKYHDATGRFFARLENGENLLDVYNRVSLFITTKLERVMHASSTNNFIIVTHGNTMRVMKMFLENLPVEAFRDLELPKNAGCYHFTYDEQTREYKFLGEI